MISAPFATIQGRTKAEAEQIAKALGRIPDRDLPPLLRFIKGLNYEKIGYLGEADHILLDLYKDEIGAVDYWGAVNDFRIAHHKEISNDRPKVLTNIVGGRIGLGLITNADTICFTPGQELGRGRTSHITYRPLKDSFHDILSQLPDGWSPDYVLFFLSEVYPLVKGLELSPYPVIGLPGDPWKINKLCWDIKFFDAFMPAMKHMCSCYGRLGEARVFYHSCSGTQGYVPWAFVHPNGSAVKKDYDVVATGTVSSPFYRKRSRYLWRLLKLADRYKVFVGRTETINECYELMSRAKIVVHCASIQGGINLRPFEAIASGALLLHEEGDGAIAEFFNPGKEIVLFNEHNFEELIQYYLTHDDERERIISHAIKRNRGHASICKNLANVLEEIGKQRVTTTQRSAEKMSEDERLNAAGISAFYARDYSQASSCFAKAIQLNPDNPKLYNNLAVCLMVKAVLNKQKDSTIRPLLQSANKPEGGTPISQFNLLSYYAYLEPEPYEFTTIAHKLIDDLTAKYGDRPVFEGDELFFYLEDPVEGFPNSFIFRMDLEFLMLSNPTRGPQYQRKVSQTLLWRTLEYVGDYYERTGDVENAVSTYMLALQYGPDNEYIMEKLAKLLVLCDRVSEAENVLHNLLTLSPLHEGAHMLLSEIELALNRKEALRERVCRLLHFKGLKMEKQFQRILDQIDFQSPALFGSPTGEMLITTVK